MLEGSIVRPSSLVVSVCAVIAVCCLGTAWYEHPGLLLAVVAVSLSHTSSIAAASGVHTKSALIAGYTVLTVGLATIGVHRVALLGAPEWSNWFGFLEWIFFRSLFTSKGLLWITVYLAALSALALLIELVVCWKISLVGFGRLLFTESCLLAVVEYSLRSFTDYYSTSAQGSAAFDFAFIAGLGRLQFVLPVHILSLAVFVYVAGKSFPNSSSTHDSAERNCTGSAKT